MGPTLVQLPPRWKRDVKRLDQFLDVVPPSMRLAVELRDPSWLDDEVFSVLERHSAALCIHDLLADHPWIRTADWTYVRFHGPDARHRAYVERYGGRGLWRAADRVTSWLDQGVDAYVYFNNDAAGAAVEDPEWFRTRLDQI